ncbi:MAG: hypothetical protein JNM40_12485 [Myxococcales bacterium]|nr:hypothetical protein [Myxococcales bacterium]
MLSIRSIGKGTLCLPLCVLALGCSHQQTPAGPVPSSETLIPQVDAQALKAEPAGQLTGPHFLSATTEEDGHTDWNLPLQEGQCYTFSGIGGQGVKQLYLYLWDQAEKRVATEKPERPQVTLRYCPEVSGSYHLQAKTGEGHGPMAVGVYAVAAPPKAVPPPPPPPPPQLDLGQIIDQQAMAAAPGAIRVGDFYRGVAGGGNDRSDWFTTLEPGRCYWFIGAGAPTVKELYLYLWNPQLQRVSDNRSSSNRSMMGHCPMVPGMYKIEAKVSSGKGEYQLGVYVK